MLNTNFWSNQIITISQQNTIFQNNSEVYDNTHKFCDAFDISLETLILYQKKLSELKNNAQFIDNYVFSDFDDTLYSRSPQLERDMFAKARWEEGNKVVESMWIKKFISEYYSPTWVVESIKKHTNIVLTAWREDFQSAKLDATVGKKMDRIIVPNQKLKPKEILHHFLFTLEKIPVSFEFYDDRMKPLMKQFQLLSEFLQNTVVVGEVTLDKDFPNKIESIDSNIFVNGKLSQMH